MPDMICAAARFTVVMPEPQKRSKRHTRRAHVVAGVECCHAAQITALLARLR